MFDGGSSDATDRVGSIGSNGLNLTIPNQLSFAMQANLGFGEAIKLEGRGSINFIRTGAITLAEGSANNGQWYRKSAWQKCVPPPTFLPNQKRRSSALGSSQR
jgi:hypothetical protein